MKLSPEQWQRLKGVLADAINEHETGTRAEFMRCACDDDHALLLEATALLNEAGTMLRQSHDQFEACAHVAATSLRRADSGCEGKRVGAYLLSEQIGRGGMGAVFLAERADGEFERKVAVKLLKRGTDTDEVLRRFRAEQQILAALEHPNIARLLDAGTTGDGLPYFVMEYVDGVPVTRYVAANELSIDERLRLFLRICAAVEMAHAQRVVHRDLKPSNILVTRAGEPKLLDFGIAKILAPEFAADLTITAHQLLTPASASPEQVRGDAVTRASDVYALGALLYEMLTGQAPHRFERLRPSHDEMVRVICETEALPLSSAARPTERRLMHRDLNRIVLYALRKEPQHRYRSVAAFAKDIERFLEGRPVTARPITLLYRAERFVKRHRAAVIGATAGLLVILTGAAAIWALGPARARDGGASANASADSILVLPFVNIGAPGGDAYIAAGIQDEVRTDLGRLHNLHVVTRAPSERGGDAPGGPLSVARSIGVRHVLRGTVERTDDRLRVTAQLLDANSGAQLWTERYERAPGDLLRLQRELAGKIVAALRLKMSGAERAAIKEMPTRDIEAYDLYLRARATLKQFGVVEFRDNYLKAVALLEATVARDPQFAEAYALLAWAQLSLYKFPYDREPRRLTLARTAAEKALALAPDFPESHLAWARYLYYGQRDYLAAREALTRASFPSNGDSFVLSAAIERRLGNWSKAIADARTAVELEPADPLTVRVLSHLYVASRRYDEAIAVCDRAIPLMSTEEAAAVWAIRISAEEERGETAKARQLLRDAPEIAMKSYRLALLTAYAGEDEEANRLAADVSNDPLEQRMALILRGVLARKAGEQQASRRLLRQARAFLEPLVNDPVDPEALAQIGIVDALLGDFQTAANETAQAIELLPISRDAVAGPGVERARILVQALSGHVDEALTALRELVQRPYGPSAGELRFDPIWDELRSSPEFAGVIEQAAQPIIAAEGAAKQ